MQTRGQQWRLTRKQDEVGTEEVVAAQSCYIFCLVASAIRDGSILGADLPPLARAMAIHFQAIAAEAAAEVVGGESISFGWPRPEGTGFRPALHSASTRLNLGKPLEDNPLWSNGREKDAGIDVIAWRDFPDRRPGKLVLLGQVASGRDWVEKTVTRDTPRFLSWFSERPMQHFVPAIFIPFPQHHDCSGKADAAFEAVAKSEAWLREQEFGLVVDRLRIVVAAARRMVRVESASGSETLVALGNWIEDAVGIARAAA